MSPKPTTIAVIGGSYAGTAVVKALEAALGTAATIVLVERRSHRVNNMAGLRAAIKPGFEEAVITPFDKAFKHAKVVTGEVTDITDKEVILKDAPAVPFDYAVIATGSSYASPAKVNATTKEDIEGEFKSWQTKVKDAKDIIVLGGGPVGVELVGELQENYPAEKKNITLITSAAGLLHTIKPKHGDRALRLMEAYGTKVVVGTKVASVTEEGAKSTVTTEDGKTYTADIVFKSYGVTPNVEPLRNSLSNSLVEFHGSQAVGVANTLQVIKSSADYKYGPVSDVYSNIFAVGDVTSIPETKMAARIPKAAGVVVTNIQKLIKGEKALATFTPQAGEFMLVSFGSKDGFTQLTVPIFGAISVGMLTGIKTKDLFSGRIRSEMNYKATPVKA